MKILLDTNFILACVKQKVDLTEFDEGAEWIVPQEVVSEIQNIIERKNEKITDRNSARVSLKILDLIKPTIIPLKNPNVDQGILDYIHGKNIVLATLDKKLKRKSKNKKLIIKGRKKLEII